MAIYALADLHLSLSIPGKTMEVFGSSWGDYISRVKDNWESTLPVLTRCSLQAIFPGQHISTKPVRISASYQNFPEENFSHAATTITGGRR